jgi:hypothetical protein
VGKESAGNKLFADCLPQSLGKPSCFLGLLQTLVNTLQVGRREKCGNNLSFAECHEYVECILKTRSSIIVCRVHYGLLYFVEYTFDILSSIIDSLPSARCWPDVFGRSTLRNKFKSVTPM